MALNLSTLTGATSGEVLAEVLTTADFLEPVPVLRNLARGSNKGGDAEQDVALNQPKALPLIDGEGYLYLSPVGGNNASIPDEAALDITGDITLECDFIVPSQPLSSDRALVVKYNTSTNNRSFYLALGSASYVGFVISQDGTYNPAFSKFIDFSSVLSGRTRATVKVTWRQSDGRLQFFIKESDGSFTQIGSDQTIAATSIYNSNQPVEIGSVNNGTSTFGGYLGVFGARIYASIDGTDKRLDVDFTATNVRHNDTKFKCATGQVVTINQSGNDPATVIKKPVLRFDGVNDALRGVFANNINGGYMFAAFSVLGTGGEGAGRTFTINRDSYEDYVLGGATFGYHPEAESLRIYSGGIVKDHTGLFDDLNRDILHEAKITNGNQLSKVNNADLGTTSISYAVNSNKFNIAANESDSRNSGENTAIDLEYLALFPASITDEQADAVRNYINNRNNVFDLKDGFGYYFFDPQSLSSGAVTSWNGRIVGSDNGDTDKLAAQTDANDQPVGDGYVVTFADNTDHLDIPSTTQAGWQVVGTSLGTFAYRVDSDAVTELNLLGNLGDASYRQAGDLYGVILLPDTATNKDIQEARQLLIDRGAADGVTVTNLSNFWRSRADIVKFHPVDTSSVTNFTLAWYGNNLTSFPLIDTSNGTNFSYGWMSNNLTSFPLIDTSNGTIFPTAWYGNNLTSFPLIDTSNGTNFQSTWQNNNLTSFPLIDTSNGTIFQSAWRGNDLTSFPLIDTSSGTSFSRAWQDNNLTSFPLIDTSSGTSFSAAWQNNNLTSFPLLDTSSGTSFWLTWKNNNLTSFPLIDTSSSTYFGEAWQDNNLLTDFPAGFFDGWNPSSITTSVFNLTWGGCTSLTAQSVENILTSIDASGKYATSTGASGGAALADAGIDIDYNVATGSLSAATTAAIDSLSGKGWQVFINGELVIPNILDLQPAAAYSLRSFDADLDPNVVNVRRSSDNATSDFTASEVSDGTLTDWVNTEYNKYTSDFSSGVDGWSSDGGNSYDFNQSVAGVTQALKITNVSNNYGYKTVGAVNGLSYRFSAKVYIPSSNTSLNSLKFRFGYVPTNEWMTDSINTLDQWVTVTVNSYTNPMTSGAEKLYWYHDSAATSGDVFYLKDVGVTQLTADGHVTTWYDQGGTNHATQATASSQPKIVDGGTLVTDSANNPAIIGDGVDDTLVHPTLTNELDSSDFLVTAAYQDELTMGITGSIPRLYLTNSSMSYNTLGTVSYPTQAGRNVMSFQVAGNTQEVFGNGTSLATASEAQVDIGQNMFNVMQGGSTFSDDPLLEVVVFGDNQSANRTGIENNINDHFDIYS